MTIRAAILDLDGTLVDSAPHICNIINDMLEDRGIERRVGPDAARVYLTQGGHELVTALLGEDCADPVADVAEFREHYAERSTPENCLFEGVRDGLALMRNQGVRLAVCSNKPQALCDRIVADLRLGGVIDAVIGSRQDVPLKPAPDLARLSLESLRTQPSQCVYVGDSEVDRRAAGAIGVDYLFVTYGYAEPGIAIDAAARFDRFDEVARFIADRAVQS